MKALAPKASAFNKLTKDPIKAQERVLLKYLARNARTEYGLKHDFRSIKSISEFRKRVPVSDYETIRHYIDRMKKGEGNILTSDKVTYFGITSGTTGTPKLIPATRYSDARKGDLMDLWAYYVCRDHPRVVDGKILGIISPEVKSHTEAGIPYGPEDGHAYNHLLGIVKRLYVLPYEIFYIEDYDARYYCILRIAVEHNVTTIATLNPSSLVLLCQRIPDVQEKIISDIERGTLDASFNIPPDIRAAVEKTLRPNPRRSGELRKIVIDRGGLLPKYFWPGLELIECWKGGTVKCYLQQVGRYFGNVAVRDFGCLSTEARSSVPTGDKGADGVLAVQTNFYEFIPKEDMDSPRKRMLLCNELKAGREYLLIVTTPGGLYRYNIDDVVRVTGFFHKTPTIEFVQKGRNAVSITGEKVYESHINEAVTRACAKHKIPVQNFCAAAVREKGRATSRYIFMVEFIDAPSRARMREFLMSVEDELRRQNSEYDDLRKQQLISFPSLKVVNPGEFERYRRGRVAKGSHDTQFKMPKLAMSADLEASLKAGEELFVSD
jgi:hypothetical protein